jgi:hypothetical protein
MVMTKTVPENAFDECHRLQVTGTGISALDGTHTTYGIGIYPTTREDWAYNFSVYTSAPVHHLQAEAPGALVFGAGYVINSITGVRNRGNGKLRFHIGRNM